MPNLVSGDEADDRKIAHAAWNAALSQQPEARGVVDGEVEQRAHELLKSATTYRRERAIKDQNAVVYREDAIAAIAAAITGERNG
jgi:hypothetical protein